MSNEHLTWARGNQLQWDISGKDLKPLVVENSYVCRLFVAHPIFLYHVLFSLLLFFFFIYVSTQLFRLQNRVQTPITPTSTLRQEATLFISFLSLNMSPTHPPLYSSHSYFACTDLYPGLFVVACARARPFFRLKVRFLCCCACVQCLFVCLFVRSFVYMYVEAAKAAVK